MTPHRRKFLTGLAVALGGGGIALNYWARWPGPNPLLNDIGPGQHTFNAYLKIGEDGTVIVAVPRAEMGQGVQTALAKLVADELDVPWANVQIEQPPPSKHYINQKLLGEGLWFVLPHDHGRLAEIARASAEFASGYFASMQLTGGSSSVRAAWEPMRRAGATARAMLIQTAAERWQVAAARLITEQGKVVDPKTKRTLGYGDLAAKAVSVVLPRRIRLDEQGPYRLIGTSNRRLDTADKVNGKAIFGLDVKGIKGSDLLYAAVRSVPTLSGRIATRDGAEARSQAGVNDVIGVDERTVAVVADSYWTAQCAAQKIHLTFEDQNTWLSSGAISADFAQRMATEDGHVFRDDGDARAQLKPPRTIFEADYQAPYVGHACMEPLNCTAKVSGDKCELWLGTQAPGLVVCAVSHALRIWPSAVTVHTTLLGGGFGRRLEADIAVQAALIAKEFPGKAVKLIWSREEDMRRDVFRPAARAHLAGALNGRGMPQAIFARLCSQSVTRDFLKRNLGLPFPAPDKTNAEGLYDQPYDIPHYRVEHVEARNEVPVGNWRSVGNAFNGFAMECFLDELACEGHQDQFEMRRRLLGRFHTKQAVLDQLHELSRWGEKLPGVDGRGMAYRQNFNADVAQVVDIAIEDKQIRVKQVYCVIDCGQPIDPRGIKTQVESSIVFGLSAALMQTVTIKDGCVQQSNFHEFDALRINQCPEIKIKIIRGNKEIGGAGETAVPPVAPALANALFAATGQRVRELPLSLNWRVA
jgi:isoquinoline 1-oxidoreductase beta subunit